TTAPVLQQYASYDSLGRVLSATRFNLDASASLSQPARAVTTTRTYDDTLRRYTETTKVGQRVPRTVQTDWVLTPGNTWRRDLTLPDGRTTRTSFDGDGRVVQLGRANGLATTFTWLDDLLEETSSAKPGAPLSRSTAFDSLAQPTAWTTTASTAATPALRVSVVRDVVGRVVTSNTSFSTATGGTSSWRGYAYDAMGRLSAVRELGALPSGTVTPHLGTTQANAAMEAVGTAALASRWAYGREAAVGSLLTISRTDISVPTPRFSAPPRASGHQLTSYDIGDGSRAVAHDDSGRVISDGTQGFVFDDMGALARVDFPFPSGSGAPAPCDGPP
ncbi:MAG: hypothetical protein JNM17_25870, partial [Archangium sp.]|nr:hypothetical protein [Archangium sp.]